jgi:hypothetical protein
MQSSQVQATFVSSVTISETAGQNKTYEIDFSNGMLIATLEGMSKFGVFAQLPQLGQSL